MEILIITGKFGMGHISAARSLAAQLRRDIPEAEVLLDDIYHIAFPRGCNNIYKTYDLLMTTPCSKLINSAYRKAVHAEGQTREAISLIEKQALRRLAEYLAMLCPDLVITTYSLAARLLSDYKLLSGDPLPLITCITDITIHNVWTNPGTDLYLAAAEETRQSLLNTGVPDHRIAVTGVPVAASYQPKPCVPRRGCRELLVMGGGLGMLPREHDFYQGLSRIPGLHTTVICGKNRKMWQRLQARRYANIDVVGYTEEVPQYMRQADLLLSKPGGVTMFEAIHSELPMLVVQPFLEQEIRNARFIAEHGLGVVLEQGPEQCLGQLETIVKSDLLLDMMRAAQHRFRSSLDQRALTEYLLSRFRESRRIPA